MMNQDHDFAAVHDVVRACWAALLELPLDEVSLQANFFAAGGDSLLAVELVATLSERLGVEVPLDPLFFDGTFGALADVCSTTVAADQAP